jgi:hypothetical protein
MTDARAPGRWAGSGRIRGGPRRSKPALERRDNAISKRAQIALGMMLERSPSTDHRQRPPTLRATSQRSSCATVVDGAWSTGHRPSACLRVRSSAHARREHTSDRDVASNPPPPAPAGTLNGSLCRRAPMSRCRCGFTNALGADPAGGWPWQFTLAALPPDRPGCAGNHWKPAPPAALARWEGSPATSPAARKRAGRSLAPHASHYLNAPSPDGRCSSGRDAATLRLLRRIGPTAFGSASPHRHGLPASPHHRQLAAGRPSTGSVWRCRGCCHCE